MNRLLTRFALSLLIPLLIPLTSGITLVEGQETASTQSDAPAEQAAESSQTPEAAPEVSLAVLDEEGRLVRFERDIAPILRDRCLECHGPEDAKNDFRVDDVDTLFSYVEPEDLESSTMYIDYLVSEDDDYLMPPRTHNGPLSASELALIRVWIEEGAHWPDGFELVAADAENAGATEPEAPPQKPQTWGERFWAFQGFFHPATIHFPIALFLLGGLFVVLGCKWPAVGTQIPLACLLLGSLTAVASSLMGWSFAPEQGYGTSWDILDWDREIDVHRWSGVIVTGLSVLLALIALLSLWKDSEKLKTYWKVGLLVLAGMVGLVGHQGGELSYGKDFYPKAFRILLDQDDQAVADQPAQEPAEEQTAESESE